MKTTIVNILKLILACLICLFIASADAYSQTVRQEGNNFIQVSTGSSRSDTLVTQFTYQVNDIKYPITINRKTTRCWIWKKDNKTKTYVPVEVEQAVCEKMGITYIPKKRRSK